MAKEFVTKEEFEEFTQKAVEVHRSQARTNEKILHSLDEMQRLMIDIVQRVQESKE